MVISEVMDLSKKLEILSDAAKYDVACTSSGVDRKGGAGMLGNAVKRGICHCFAADGRCISLLKILLTNECIFDCKYCLNRSSNDVVRVSFTPEEVADLTIEFYRRNYIEGLFLSSGIMVSPDHTMSQMLKAVYLLRTKHKFNGYIHVKAIPGADQSLIQEMGLLADRMSINLELPTSEGLKNLAPHKSRKNILTPMKQIQLGIKENRNELLAGRRMSKEPTALAAGGETQLALNRRKNEFKQFVPSGQSTQVIIGATPETDFQIIHVAESLYQKFELKRVFYSAFVNTTHDSLLPVLEGGPPLLREHRLYQADWLLRFYGFQAGELLSEDKPNFNMLLDPKCNWALNHLEEFPIEVNKADYKKLLRIPGIGVKSAQRIVSARKHARLDFSDLKRLGVVLKRALYFITCNGKMMYPVKIEEDYILNHMLEFKEKLPAGIGGSGIYQQLSLFDDVKFSTFNGVQGIGLIG
ncbi:putative DNA modification/repair radical SAM protein [Anaeromicropila populeti]|uniref:Putative DNA modification/repair radical SAM protein n=1 Tax=Anaeromicropila populeti TaxID=37658 RepID=A0A1I6KR27_9FIRM|nr:putative DNA modification/repair radical SAM protein [Anaeromicropila populeti]SFR93705.1 putative DNA modification/repair radical SAM protein [Anaeromicropila populeti]